MAAIPLTSLECTLEAERLLEQSIHRSGADSDRAIAMANVYAQLARVAIIREHADRATESGRPHRQAGRKPDMSKEQEPSTYKTFACGYDCHPDRYTVFTTRTRLGMKRWGIRDNHMDIRLPKLCKSRYAAETWRIQLATMEIRERQAIREAPELRDLWNTR